MAENLESNHVHTIVGQQQIVVTLLISCFSGEFIPQLNSLASVVRQKGCVRSKLRTSANRREISPPPRQIQLLSSL